MTKRLQPAVTGQSEIETSPVAVDPNAPFLFFDNIPAMGVANGIFSIVLSNSRPTAMTDGQVPNLAVVLAQLQCSMNGLQRLRAAIDRLILLAANASDTIS
jgi:hypothetical protein